MGGGGYLIHRMTNRNIKKGLVRIKKKVPKYKPPKWQDLTYKSKEITPHIKGEQRGKKVVTKTTYHGVKNPDNLSKRKLKKEFAKGTTEGLQATHVYPDPRLEWKDDKYVNNPEGSRGGYVGPADRNSTHVTQKITTKYHDSKRWNDSVQDRKKKEITYKTGRYRGGLYSDRDHDTKTTYRSKTKHLRSNKEGQASVKKKYETAGIKGLKNVKVRGKVDREATNKYKDPACGEPFGFCPNHADGTIGTMGNKPLKTTHVRTYKKGTSADDAFAGRLNPSGNPLAMNEMIGYSVKKIKSKSYGDKRGTQSIVGHPDGKAPQYKSNRGKVNKKKIKFHDRTTIKLRQNIFDDDMAQSHSPVAGYIKAKDFRQLKRDPISRQSWKNWKKTGKINNNIASKND